MFIRKCLLAVTASITVVFVASSVSAQKLVSGFEGDLSSVYGIDWNLDFNGIITNDFVTDDPGDSDTEGVTEGSQALSLGHTLWDVTNQPWMELDATGDSATSIAMAQDIIDFDFIELRMTPLVNLAGPGFQYRQAFLSMATNGLSFAVAQVDLANEGFADTGQPNGGTLQWDLTQEVTDSGDGPNAGTTKTWKQWAQDTIDAGEEALFTLRFIYQGANNDFFEFPVGTAIDNLRFVNDAAEPIVGDYNEDGVVNAADYTAYRDNIGGAADAIPNRDPNLTGTIGQDDYVAWTLAYGGTAGSSSVAIPEPSAGLLLLVGMVASTVRRASVLG
ncbi:MAG: hypothetical protein AAF266_05100 [Planctomycetota bacterium]